MNDFLIELDGELIAEIYKYRQAMNPDQFTKDLAAAKESKRQFDEMRRAIEAAPESRNGTAGRDEIDLQNKSVDSAPNINHNAP